MKQPRSNIPIFQLWFLALWLPSAHLFWITSNCVCLLLDAEQVMYGMELFHNITCLLHLRTLQFLLILLDLIKCLFHSFIHSLSVTAYPLQGRGGLEPIPADMGRRQVASSITGQTTVHAHIHTSGKSGITDKPHLHIFALWKAGAPAETLNPGPSCCEATVLTTDHCFFFCFFFVLFCFISNLI